MMRQQTPLSSSPCAPSPQNIYSIVSTDFWLVVASPHPAEAIEIQSPIALSIFNFSNAQFTAQNDE